VEQRQVIYDTSGYIAELFPKTIHQGSLDATLTKKDTDRLLTFLQTHQPNSSSSRHCAKLVEAILNWCPNNGVGHITLSTSARQVHSMRRWGLNTLPDS
jgi:hypothetical protein